MLGSSCCSDHSAPWKQKHSVNALQGGPICGTSEHAVKHAVSQRASWRDELLSHVIPCALSSPRQHADNSARGSATAEHCGMIAIGAVRQLTFCVELLELVVVLQLRRRLRLRRLLLGGLWRGLVRHRVRLRKCAPAAAPLTSNSMQMSALPRAARSLGSQLCQRQVASYGEASLGLKLLKFC